MRVSPTWINSYDGGSNRTGQNPHSPPPQKAGEKCGLNMSILYIPVKMRR